MLSVRDGIGRIALKQLTVNILTGLQIVTSVMPNGYAGNSYSEAVRISGGIAPFTYTVSGGSALPDGLTLNQNTGIISGTASFGGLTNVQITVADSSFPTRQTREKILGLRIWSQLTIISSAVLPNARKNVALSPVTLVAKGGTSPYTWSVSSGFLPDGLSLDPGTGRLSGTPKDRGDFVFTIRCSDGSATAAIVEKQFFIHISDALAVTTGAVPGGATGLPYSASLAASGGLKPYGWGVKAGTLPPGLSLDSATGAITGTPTAKTTSSVIFEVTDGDAPAQQAQKSLFFEVSDTLTIYDAILPNSRLNQPYHANVRAQLGTPPYSWRIASGTLPPGITLGQDAGIATLQGTAQTAGSYALELEVSDNGTPVQQVSRSYTVIVHPEIAISTSALKTAVRGAPYVDAVAASGGAPPYTYSIVAGTLPAGLTFNSSTGDIYGSVNLSAGQSALLTVRATDGGYPSAYVDKEFSISAIDPLAISTATLQGALQKSSYGPVSLAASGGLSPYSWTLANSSTLPQGVALSSAGVLSGTPVLCGSFPFSVQAADSSVIANTSQKAYSLVVTCANDYDLAGSLGADGAGATVTLSGPQSKTATADASGNYLFQHLVNGSYTVTPAKAQRWFSPVSRTLTVENLDLGSIGFSTTIDGTGPTVSAFTVPAAVNSTSVPISALSAADNAGGSGLAAYLISESATAPLAAAAGWSATKPATFTIATGVDGDRTLYAFAKDGAGNVSSGRSATVKLDTTAPTVSAFTIPLTVNNTRSVTITTLAVSDAAGGSGVSAYLLSETSAIPTAVDSRWSAVKPTSYTFTSDGVHTLRAFVKDQVGNISAPAGAAVTNTYTLTVALTGSGSGSVNSTPTGIACANGSSAGCSSNFTGGATVNLTATAGAYSAFGGWSGICSGNGGCTAGMDAARTVTATFAPLPRARIAGTTPAYYFTLQAAYNAATDGAVIQLLEGSFTETLTANRPIRVTVKGGYKAGYGAVSSETVLQRQIVLRAGTVRMEKVFVK
ncbi:MAG: hypothetical protein A2075_18620 [Geobacteraceae bacterium GWC2_58_44]|nr:MAG: hypothetical protein A2075_18620 [Geobacteraceae bacterium GWC2_58_44]